MRLIRRTLWTLFIVALVALAVAYSQRDRISRLMAVNALFSPDRIAQNFSHMDAAFLTAPIPRGTDVGPLPEGTFEPLPPEAAQWIEDRQITGLVVVHDGRVVHQDYYRGTGSDDLRAGWSLSKSFLSALVGIEMDAGRIGSLDDGVVKYVPALAGGAYDGVTLRQALQMTSGVHFSEDYADRDSDINRLARSLALGGSIDAHVAELKAVDTVPGDTWRYNSMDAQVVAMVLRGASGQSIAQLLSDRLVKPLGMEAAPYTLTDSHGVAFALGGLSMRTRDYARFGQMMLDQGRWNGTQVVPPAWVAISTQPAAPTPSGGLRYGDLWWLPKDGPDGEYFARGIYGQYIWIDTARRTVIAVNAVDAGYNDPGVTDRMIAMFRRIGESLVP